VKSKRQHVNVVGIPTPDPTPCFGHALPVGFALNNAYGEGRHREKHDIDRQVLLCRESGRVFLNLTKCDFGCDELCD
jgi:hypothetical protein